MMNYNNKIKVIGFDLDQTLYPKSPKIDEAIQIYIYQKIDQHKKCGLKKAEELFKGLYQEGRGLSGSKTLIKLGIPNAKDVVQEALENADIASFLKPNQKTINLLQKLKDRYHNLDLITGSNINIVLDKLAKLEIPKDIFLHIIANASKSDGQAYKIWLSYYKKFKAEEFIYIGDRVSDHLVPKTIGIQTILINITKKDNTIDCPQLSSIEKLESFLL